MANGVIQAGPLGSSTLEKRETAGFSTIVHDNQRVQTGLKPETFYNRISISGPFEHI